MNKKIRNIIVIIISLIFAFSFVACAAGDTAPDGDYGYGGDDIIAGELAGSTEGDYGETGDTEDKKEDSNSQTTVTKPAGLLTAGAWDDNAYYSEWLKLFTQGETNGKFFNFHSESENWGFNSTNRLSVEVKTADGVAIRGATVEALNEWGDVAFTAITNANGIAYLFPKNASGSVKIKINGEPELDFAYSPENRALYVEHTPSSEIAKVDDIELMFVIDVTGSMGDELEYLKAEVADVINRVATANANARINLALLFYRDHGDNEIFAYHDFRNVLQKEGMDYMQSAISKQRAKGGGDYEEAVDEALELAVNKQWSDSDSTKIIFHVLDAPPHSNDENMTRYKKAVLTAAEKGIRICPIICSGTDGTTEYLVRQSAVYSGGTFVFITDDSGIGNSHYDPQLPNVTVEALNSLMVRLINGYHTGVFEDPTPWRDEIQSEN